LFQPNDIVFLEAEPEPYIGLIVRIFENRKDKALMATIRWFYRWRDVSLDHDISHVTRSKYTYELFLGMVVDDNVIETLIEPCDVQWAVEGTTEQIEERKQTFQQNMKFFCSHIYCGDRLIPLFHPRLESHLPENFEDILRLRESIANRISVADSEDIEVLTSSAKQKKRKAPSSTSVVSKSKKERKIEDAKAPDNYGTPTFEEIKSITLDRRSMLMLHQSKNRKDLAGFFVRVPVQCGDIKSYELALIEDLTPIPDSKEMYEGFPIHSGLRIKLPHIPHAMDSGIQHISSNPPLEEEYHTYLRQTPFPNRNFVKTKLEQLALLTREVHPNGAKQ